MFKILTIAKNILNNFNAVDLAAMKEDIQSAAILTILIEAGVNINHSINAQTEFCGNTALLIAMRKGNLTAVKSLVGAGAKLNEAFSFNTFDANVSLEKQNLIKSYIIHAPDVQKLLLLSLDLHKIIGKLFKAKPNDPTVLLPEQGSEEAANVLGLSKTIELLIQEGTDVNCHNFTGSTPLQYGHESLESAEAYCE